MLFIPHTDGTNLLDSECSWLQNKLIWTVWLFTCGAHKKKYRERIDDNICFASLTFNLESNIVFVCIVTYKTVGEFVDFFPLSLYTRSADSRGLVFFCSPFSLIKCALCFSKQFMFSVVVVIFFSSLCADWTLYSLVISWLSCRKKKIHKIPQCARIKKRKQQRRWQRFILKIPWMLMFLVFILSLFCWIFLNRTYSVCTLHTLTHIQIHNKLGSYYLLSLFALLSDGLRKLFPICIERLDSHLACKNHGRIRAKCADKKKCIKLLPLLSRNLRMSILSFFLTKQPNETKRSEGIRME